MERSIFAALGIVAAALIAAPASTRAADGPIVIKFPHDVAPTQLKGLAAERMRKLVRERLKGKVELQVFPSGSLYPDEVQAIQALQAGAVQLVSPTFAKWSPLVPEFSLFELPYVVTSKEMMRALVDSPEIGGKLFKEKLREKGLLGLALAPNGFRDMIVRRKPITKLEDFAGLKVRIQPSAMFVAFMKAAGASSQALPWSETYSALSTGVVDAAEAPLDAIYGAKLQEVAKYVSTTHHVFNAYLVATNAKFWDGLPADIRDELQKILDEVSEWQWDYVEKLQADSRKKLIEAGAKINDISPEERARMAVHFRKVHEEFKDVIGEDLLKAVYAVADRYNR